MIFVEAIQRRRGKRLSLIPPYPLDGTSIDEQANNDSNSQADLAPKSPRAQTKDSARGERRTKKRNPPPLDRDILGQGGFARPRGSFGADLLARDILPPRATRVGIEGQGILSLGLCDRNNILRRWHKTKPKAAFNNQSMRARDRIGQPRQLAGRDGKWGFLEEWGGLRGISGRVVGETVGDLTCSGRVALGGFGALLLVGAYGGIRVRVLFSRQARVHEF